LRITEIRMKIVEKDMKLKAYADITFERAFVIHGVKLIDGQNGLFVAMPSKRMADGEYKDLVHPILPEVRQYITDTVVEKYEEEKASKMIPIMDEIEVGLMI
jgi:stage V sporulation protein G